MPVFRWTSGLVTAWNRKAEALFQWSAADAIGQRLERLIISPEAARAHVESVGNDLRTGAAHALDQVRELTALRRDGTSITVEVRIKALDIGGEKIFSAFLSDISARKEIEALLEREVRQDMLTGLLNRRTLTELLPQAIARADCSKQTFALLFVDLDGFKAVNDDFGNESGDMVLCAVADRLRACLRKVDSAVRLSGDEFVVVVEAVNGLEDGQRVATKLLESIAEPIALHRVSVSVGASAGIALYQPGTGMSGDAVLNGADARMYEAKRAGKGRIVPA
ncbi:sensor domain-containing diguanylate cyclase [Parazoarcus communis]|nr:sensor domain-containing diguanylate cyclase [Parazoarcus communis]